MSLDIITYSKLKSIVKQLMQAISDSTYIHPTGDGNMHVPATGIEVSTETTWNPEDKQADVVLSNGNLTATCTLAADGIYHSVRSTTGKTSGKWYYECNAGGSSGYVVSAGLNSGDVLLTTLANRWMGYTKLDRKDKVM